MKKILSDMSKKVQKQITEQYFNGDEIEDNLSSALTFATPLERYQSLGPDHWAVYIDTKHHSIKGVGSRRKTYDEGMHGGIVEKGYYRSMRAANEIVQNTLEKELTLPLYGRIHYAALKHREYHGLEIRTGKLTIKVKSKDSDLEDVSDFLYIQAIADECYQVTYKNIDVKQVFREIMKNYYKNIQLIEKPEQKLLLIAKTHQDLERLHLFEDGNARTNKLVLNKFLAENDLDLCILDTPLGVELIGLKSWIKKIEKGQKFWQYRVQQVKEKERLAYLKKQEMRTLERKLRPSLGIKYDSSDTSSGDELELDDYVEELNKFPNSLSFIEVADFHTRSTAALMKFVEIIGPKVIQLSRKASSNKRLLITLLLFVKKKKDKWNTWNASIKNEAKLHIWIARIFFELHLINKTPRTFDSFIMHLDLVLKNEANEKNKSLAIDLLKISKQQSLTPGQIDDIQKLIIYHQSTKHLQ